MFVVWGWTWEGTSGELEKKTDYFFHLAHLLSPGRGEEGCALVDEDGSELGRNLEPAGKWPQEGWEQRTALPSCCHAGW